MCPGASPAVLSVNLQGGRGAKRKRFLFLVNLGSLLGAFQKGGQLMFVSIKYVFQWYAGLLL